MCVVMMGWGEAHEDMHYCDKKCTANYLKNNINNILFIVGSVISHSSPYLAYGKAVIPGGSHARRVLGATARCRTLRAGELHIPEFRVPCLAGLLSHVPKLPRQRGRVV